MIIIAIDGPSGAGKGTIARYLSTLYQWPHVDSGLLYRYAGLYCLEFQKAASSPYLPSDTEIELLCQKIHTLGMRELMLYPGELRLEKTAGAVSKIATYPLIREAVTAWMHKQAELISHTSKGLVVDGRDIATVVFPQATVKLFITADAAIRQKRRFKETQESHAHITHHMTERDVRDSTRSVAPMSLAKDAFIIDTTHLSIDEACKNASLYVTIRCFNA